MDEFTRVPGTKYYKIDVHYDLDKHEWGEPDAEFEHAVSLCGGEFCGAGTGFGERDMDWEFDDEASAAEAMYVVEGVIAGRDGFYVSIYELEEQEEDSEPLNVIPPHPFLR